MYLARLKVENLRILEEAELSPDRHLNVVEGGNGAGKTSLLEGIHMLGTGRSFRTRRVEALVRRGARSLLVFGEVVRESGLRVGVGVEKGGGGMRVKVGGKAVEASSALAQEMALALVTPESHRLLTGGPRERRRVLDWGLFHVDRGYLELLHRYGKAVRQRNAALRSEGCSRQGLGVWDRELVAAGETLSRRRERYVAGLQGTVQKLMGALLGRSVSVSLRTGWTAGESLEQALGRSRRRDLEDRRTSVGPHRADLEFRVDGIPVEQALSRGEAKLFVSGLALAQVRAVGEGGGKTPVVLVDDLPSELDEDNRGRFMGVLADTGGQVFVTVVEKGLLDTGRWESHSLFHVEQGRVRQVV